MEIAHKSNALHIWLQISAENVICSHIEVIVRVDLVILNCHVNGWKSESGGINVASLNNIYNISSFVTEFSSSLRQLFTRRISVIWKLFGAVWGFLRRSWFKRGRVFAELLNRQLDAREFIDAISSRITRFGRHKNHLTPFTRSHIRFQIYAYEYFPPFMN